MTLHRAIGLMSGSSLDGLDIVCADFTPGADKWEFTIRAADCIPYDADWTARLRDATTLGARDYLLLHTAYGHYLGRCVRDFVAAHDLRAITLVASHGHTVFHAPDTQMTAQLGCGAAIAAECGIDTVSDLRAMDVAHGGQGAPIVPLGEKLLWPETDCFLNIGGIANISHRDVSGRITAFDICPANRVLNALAADLGFDYDSGGDLARDGVVDDALLQRLNALLFYAAPYPKSLDNGFGVDVVLPLVRAAGLNTRDALRTIVEHVAQQTAASLRQLLPQGEVRMMVTGGGAFNTFLIERMQALSNQAQIAIPDAATVNYKEALVMAALGLRRLRHETTVLASVTGARCDSIGGALWRAK